MKKKIIGVMLGIIMVSSFVGCSSGSSSNSSNKSGSTSTKVSKVDDSMTKDEFLSKGKKDVEALAGVLDKYKTKYEKSDDKTYDSADHTGTGYFLKVLTDAENTSTNDGSNSIYYSYQYSASIDNTKHTGKRILDLTIQQKTVDGDFDANKVTALKDAVIAMTGKKDYDFKGLNKRINDLFQDAKKNGGNISKLPPKVKVGNLTEELAGDVDDEGSVDKNNRTIVYRLYTNDIKIK